MMVVKHTMGPWTIKREKFDDLTAISIMIRDSRYPELGNGWGTEICRVGGDKKTALANARLIAMSPAMYKYVSKNAAAGDLEAQKIMGAIARQKARTICKDNY